MSKRKLPTNKERLDQLEQRLTEVEEDLALTKCVTHDMDDLKKALQETQANTVDQYEEWAVEDTAIKKELESVKEELEEAKGQLRKLMLLMKEDHASIIKNVKDDLAQAKEHLNKLVLFMKEQNETILKLMDALMEAKKE